jgi:hypothetical protein
VGLDGSSREERREERDYDKAAGVGGFRDRDDAMGPRDVGYSDRAAAAVRDQGFGGREDLGADVCSRREFSQVEDRPIVKERVTKILEHRPVEKRYETATKYVGESAQPGSAEHLGADTRIVSAAERAPEPEIRDRREFTEVEDRPQVKERVSRLIENHPVEKQYQTAVKYVGEQAMPGSTESLASPEERIVSRTAPGPTLGLASAQ